jgi:predicted permease
MTAQVAIAFVLLVGALLLVRSFNAMLGADLGYGASNALSARIILPNGEFTPERRQQVVDQVTDRLASTRGIVRAAAATAIPFTNTESLTTFPLKKREGGTEQVQSGAQTVSPGYFAALDQPIAEGREFTAEDGSPSRTAAIVNQAFARRYLGGRALGWTLTGNEMTEQIPIVGVVKDAVRHDVGDAAQPEIYYPIRQRALRGSDIYLIVRTPGDPRDMIPALRTIAHDAAPSAPVDSIMTMDDRLSQSLAKPRLYAVLLGTFAAFALAIAGVGLFGVLSYTVALRAREIGIRSALGAQVRDIVGLVVRQSLAIAGAGSAAGLIASLWLTKTLQKFLFGVSSHDLTSFAAVALLLLAVATLASIVPARRAARVDPIKVLRA